MSKQLTNRHIETISRELDKSVQKLVDAWREHEPYPSWEEDAEWRRQNPSPRERHALLEREVRDAVKADTDDLLLRVKLGTVPVESIYDELKLLLDRLNEQRLSYLRLPKP